MNINYNNIFNFLRPFFIVLLITYFISVLVFIFLPKGSIEYEQNDLKSLYYGDYKGFYSQKNISKKVEIKKNKNIKKLSDYTLKAIYAKGNSSGWIIVEQNKNKKSIILEQNSKLDGYILKKFFKNYVVFERNALEYKLVIPKNENIKYEIEELDENNLKEKVIVSGNNVRLERNYLNEYVTNIEKIWNNIAISDYKEDGKLAGFIVNKVNRKSVFAKLGLKKGDIIKAINGNELKSYADAFKIYNNINKIDYLNLEILRDKDILEINYEID